MADTENRPGRRTPRTDDEQELMLRGGERLWDWLEAAIGRSKRVHSVAALIRATRIGSGQPMARATLYEWKNGISWPSDYNLGRVASALGPEFSVEEMWDAYLGRERAPSTAEEALRAHTAAVERQNELLSSLVAALTAGALGVGRALAGPGTEDRLAALARAATAADPPTTDGVGERARPGEADTGSPPRGRRA